MRTLVDPVDLDKLFELGGEFALELGNGGALLAGAIVLGLIAVVRKYLRAALDECGGALEDVVGTDSAYAINRDLVIALGLVHGIVRTLELLHARHGVAVALVDLLECAHHVKRLRRECKRTLEFGEARCLRYTVAVGHACFVNGDHFLEQCVVDTGQGFNVGAVEVLDEGSVELEVRLGVIVRGLAARGRRLLVKQIVGLAEESSRANKCGGALRFAASLGAGGILRRHDDWWWCG